MLKRALNTCSWSRIILLLRNWIRSFCCMKMRNFGYCTCIIISRLIGLSYMLVVSDTGNYSQSYAILLKTQLTFVASASDPRKTYSYICKYNTTPIGKSLENVFFFSIVQKLLMLEQTTIFALLLLFFICSQVLLTIRKYAVFNPRLLYVIV